MSGEDNNTNNTSAMDQVMAMLNTMNNNINESKNDINNLETDIKNEITNSNQVGEACPTTTQATGRVEMMLA